MCPVTESHVAHTSVEDDQNFESKFDPSMKFLGTLPHFLRTTEEKQKLTLLAEAVDVQKAETACAPFHSSKEFRSVSPSRHVAK